ncbi:unnamed protein product [Enterobius vermicularis]|uniref:ATP synthase subunit epsilon, mitochondrial n=1 Tax=Enterobius vermicularis TaxID=51028 RepID=A0A0N4V8K2_ENTVE|nr:unnamed protein product [Enterobius vermicularis]
MWRSVGLTYVRYSQIAAAITRRCLRNVAKDGGKGQESTVKFTYWDAGKPVKQS